MSENEVTPPESPPPRRSVGRWVARFLVRRIPLVLLLAVAIPVTIMLMENRVIFVPTRYPDGDWDVSRFGPSVEDCRFSASDRVKLHAWWADAGPEAPVILFCHGNAGNLSHRDENMELLLQRGLSVFLFDYRGYGRSEGSPDEAGVYRDARAAYRTLREEKGVAATRIVIFGRSLGGAVALDLALDEPCAGLILESTFTSAREMARQVLPIWPLYLALRTRFASLEKIPRLKVPLLLIHGDQDEIVPYGMGQQLFAAAPEPKTFYTIESAGHNDTYLRGGGAYFRRFETFARECTGGAEPPPK